MTPEILNVVWCTPTLRGHVQRMKILVTSQIELNTSTIDLNNKRLTLLITTTSLYLDYQYSSARSPPLVLTINYWTPSKAFNPSSLKDIDSFF